MTCPAAALLPGWSPLPPSNSPFWPSTRDRYGPWLAPLLGIGLTVAVTAALIGMAGGGFFLGRWIQFEVAGETIKLGTPQLFDLGVMLVVVGMAVTYLLRLSEAAEAAPPSTEHQEPRP
jgi:hypothetical protein